MIALAALAIIICELAFASDAQTVAEPSSASCPTLAAARPATRSKNPQYASFTGHFCGMFYSNISLDIQDIGEGNFRIEFVAGRDLMSTDYRSIVRQVRLENGQLEFRTNRSATVTVWSDDQGRAHAKYVSMVHLKNGTQTTYHTDLVEAE